MIAPFRGSLTNNIGARLRTCLIATALGLFSCTASAQTQDVIRIAAIVNDEIISAFDLDNRVRLIAATSNLPDRPDALRRMRPQVLRTMIDERLQMQEAKRRSVRVSQREINATVANLERQNKMQPGQIWTFLRSRNVDRSALESQLRARISWLKLINRTLMREITVGREEVKDELERLRQLRGKPRMHVQEIFLGVDSPEIESQIRQTADRLISQIVNGARFDALAREFSQSTTAAKGGDLGWITDVELEEELAAALSVMQPGQVSQPVRTLTGYYILLLLDRRTQDKTEQVDTTIQYRQLTMPLLPDAPQSEIEAQRELAQQVSDTAKSCNDFVRIGRTIGGRDMERLNTVTGSAVAGPVRQVLMTSEIGSPSNPQRTPDGFVVIVVCSRVQPEFGLPTLDALEERMRRDRLDRMAQRFMRDLRRTSYVDLRQ